MMLGDSTSFELRSPKVVLVMNTNSAHKMETYFEGPLNAPRPRVPMTPPPRPEETAGNGWFPLVPGWPLAWPEG